MSRAKEETDYEQVGQVPLCRIVKDVIFFMSESKATGDIDNGVKFEVLSNLDGSMVIEFGDSAFTKGNRYIVNLREAVETAYEDYKKRQGL